MKTILTIATLICVLGCVLAKESDRTAAGNASRTIRVACLPARPLALTVGLQLGLFAKHAVEIQDRVAANSEELRKALGEGEVEVAHAAVDNAVALSEKAHVDVVVVVGGEGSTNELIAQPGTKSVEQLRGQTVIVDAPTTAYAIQLKKIFLQNGLQAERDYQIKAIGGTPLRLAAMREHKEYAGSIMGPPASLIAKQDGLVSLGTTREFIGAYQGVGGFARRAWATGNRDLLTDYLAAYIEAQRWILDPANKQRVVELLAREFELSNALAEEAYARWVVARDGLQREARIDLEGFRTVLRLRAEIEHTWSGATPEPEKYYDSSYFEAARMKAAPLS